MQKSDSMKKNTAGETTGGIKEIAKRAQVSIGTVDRVIHNRVGVSERTKVKILKIIEELGYQPNVMASRLASTKQISIATLLPKITKETSFWEAASEGIRQAEQEIARFGIKVHPFYFDQNVPEDFLKQVKALFRLNPSGVMLATSSAENTVQLTSRCRKKSIPFVLIDSNLEDQGSLSYVGPELYQSGYLVGQLISYLLPERSKMLLIHISKELHQHHHLLKKEAGFQAYFDKYGLKHKIVKADIRKTDQASIFQALDKVNKKEKDIKLIFVTNSRVTTVADYYATKWQGPKPIIIGYDYTRENVQHLIEGHIDFLICQKSREQAYKAIQLLYQHLAFGTPCEKVYHMPIDIITRENQRYYSN
jgi:LacI family transcriptional regulator